jgi:pyruvate dehydrogenase E2 component (dihydrolipoamide acetyltransferase)
MIDILMPRLSDTMTEGAIAQWHKHPGDDVAPGDVLLEIETDKALMEQEAYDAGTLVEILVAEGENVAIGTPIARLDDGIDHGTQPQAADNVSPQPTATATATATALSAATTPPATSPDSARRAATPLVRRLAKERGIDLATINGSGPGGRVVRADLDAISSNRHAPQRSDTAPAPASRPTPIEVPAEQDVTHVPFDGIRRAIATRLTESATTTPVFTASTSADVTDLLTLRGQLNAALAAVGGKISVNDLVVKAVAQTLRQHPTINASFSPEDGGATLIHSHVHVGIAVAAPSGLVVPVIRDADRASISTIATRAADVARRASDRSLTGDDMQGGTFTVSNLGMFGVEHFTAIINPPQGAILAVGAIRDEVALIDDAVQVRKRLGFTISCDHRIIDGAAAGRFLTALTELLESPLRLLA